MNVCGLEDKIKNANPNSWLVDGMSDTEVKWCVIKGRVFGKIQRFLFDIKHKLRRMNEISKFRTD